LSRNCTPSALKGQQQGKGTKCGEKGGKGREWDGSEEERRTTNMGRKDDVFFAQSACESAQFNGAGHFGGGQQRQRTEGIKEGGREGDRKRRGNEGPVPTTRRRRTDFGGSGRILGRQKEE
jgi:hypothetical protein